MTGKQQDKQFEKRLKTEMLAVHLTRKHIEANNLPKFMAIDYETKIKSELLVMKDRELSKLYREHNSPTNLLMWEGWEYEPLKDCLCFVGSKCDSIGECGK